MEKKRISKIKSAQSNIIATLLLILLSITTLLIIVGFVIPFVRDKLAEGDCLSVAGENLEISRSKYTCYDDINNETRVQIHILDVSHLIDGFAVELGRVSSKAIEINQYNYNIEFSMYNNDPFELPGDNEARTYVIPSSSKPDLIRVYPILKNGKVCNSYDIILDIEPCII